jgi:hypothetical protein
MIPVFILASLPTCCQSSELCKFLDKSIEFVIKKLKLFLYTFIFTPSSYRSELTAGSTLCEWAS